MSEKSRTTVLYEKALCDNGHRATLPWDGSPLVGYCDECGHTVEWYEANDE